MKRAFVTGATGFLGLNLVEALLERGAHVTALHRAGSDLRWLSRLSVERVCGTLDDAAALAACIPEGTDVIFHVAADTSTWRGHARRQWRSNVEGTRHVVEAALARGVPRLVHTSSIAAWGRVEGEVDEETPQRGDASWVPYERSKWHAEREALAGRARGLQVVVLNPSAIMGPYDLHNVGQLFFRLGSRLRLPAIPSGVIGVAHSRQVARAHVEAAERGRDGARYLLGGERGTFRELVAEMAACVGAPVPPVLPTGLARAAATVLDGVARVTGRKPLMTPEEVAIVSLLPAHFVSDRAVAELGYRVVPVGECVRDAHAWLTAEGLL